MKIWLDAQLPPALAPWLAQTFEIEAYSATFLGLERAADRQLFLAARESRAVIMTKDSDFIRLLEELGSPPQVLLITAGNTSNAAMKRLLQEVWVEAAAMLRVGENLIEIR